MSKQTETTPKKVSKLPAWAVGSDGDFNWQVMRAETEKQAKEDWIEEYGNEEDSPESLSAHRMPSWDGKEVTKRMWFKYYGAFCDVCGYETFRENCGIIDRKGLVVCEECQNDRKIKKRMEKKNARAS